MPYAVAMSRSNPSTRTAWDSISRTWPTYSYDLGETEPTENQWLWATAELLEALAGYNWMLPGITYYFGRVHYTMAGNRSHFAEWSKRFEIRSITGYL